MSAAATATLIVRCGLVILFFPFSALDKILGFEGAVKQAQEVFRPRLLAVVVLMCGLGIEIIMSLGVITGYADRLAASILAAYCAATAILYKRFWAQSDFWTAGDSKGRTLFWDFLKNLSLGAGFLLIVIGTDGSGLSPFFTNPLGSNHPYAHSQEHP